MAEVDWGTEDNVAKPKKRIPTWAWIGGGCCGVVVIGIIGMIIAGVVAGRALNNQPKNWSALAEHVQFDDSLKAGKHITRLPFQMGHEGAWQMASGETRAIQIRVFDGDNAFAMRKRLFEDKDTSAYQQIGVLFAKQIESGTLEAQGRTLTRARLVGRDAPEDASEGEDAGDKEAANEEPEDMSDVGAKGMMMPSVTVVDITPEGRSDLVLFEYLKYGATTHIPDDEVLAALAPFHVGPNR